MPKYLYECERCLIVQQHFMSIKEMEEFEKKADPCNCGGQLRRNWSIRPSLMSFRAGVYENLSLEPQRIENMQQLHDAAEKGGVYSHYAEDFRGMFGVKSGRWV